MSTNPLDAALPGCPRPRLVRQVRRWLATFGIRPQRDQWLLTWEWARNIARSYSRTMWPSIREIAAQYMVVLLAEMRKMGTLGLPYRAGRPEMLPDAIRALEAAGALALPAPKEYRDDEHSPLALEAG